MCLSRQPVGPTIGDIYRAQLHFNKGSSASFHNIFKQKPFNINIISLKIKTNQYI